MGWVVARGLLGEVCKVGPGKLTYIVNVPDIFNMQNHEPDPAYHLFLYLKSRNPTGPVSSGTAVAACALQWQSWA